MLNKHEINNLLENIEWAKLDMEKGSVYHIKWAQKYVEDVQMLLEELDPTKTSQKAIQETQE